MKKILLLTWLLVAISINATFAQYEGKRFVSATAGINFSNQNPSEFPSTNGYGYNFYAGFGKFRTANRASGWNLSSSLGGGKSIIYNNGKTDINSGLTGFGVGTGYFWQYYKHFNDKLGIFGGPNINALYDYGKSYGSPNADSEQRSNNFSLQFGVSAGAYYALNESWWLTASLGFGNLISTTASFAKTKSTTETTRNNTFDYKLSPTITVPSVGLGLRYFFKD
ncbi:hypothetical protein [Dyadobacter sp. OTU695]|uniref:hypothetical protein n=1 Tax=Dyadobacter sp. OTU695 TaxID=3043860 RepID=UPI00313BB282